MIKPPADCNEKSQVKTKLTASQNSLHGFVKQNGSWPVGSPQASWTLQPEGKAAASPEGEGPAPHFSSQLLGKVCLSTPLWSRQS